MCTYKDIELVELPNGKTVKEANEAILRTAQPGEGRYSYLIAH